MSLTRVVNKTAEEYDVYIGRKPLDWDPEGVGYGNPYPLMPWMNRGATLEEYRIYFLQRVVRDPVFREKVLELKGKRLGCWCKPKPCHGDIIVEWLEGQRKLFE